MKETDLLRYFPRLWHMTEQGSWDSIKKHGLLSTSALLDLYGIKGTDRTAIEQRRRPASVKLAAAGLAGATIRDNKPLTLAALEKSLAADMTPQAWFELLNQRTFFWLSRKRLRILLNARAHRGRTHTVLTIDTATLLAVHRERIELSPINSGAAIFKPVKRSRQTFQTIADFPFVERRNTRSPSDAVVELVVTGGIPDIAEHVVSVHTMGGRVLEEIWRRPGSDADDGP